MCRLSWNLGASISWNFQGLSGPVMGLLYLYLTLTYTDQKFSLIIGVSWFRILLRRLAFLTEYYYYLQTVLSYTSWTDVFYFLSCSPIKVWEIPPLIPAVGFAHIICQTMDIFGCSYGQITCYVTQYVLVNTHRPVLVTFLPLSSTLTLSNSIFLPTAYSPALTCFGRERGWWITCNYPTVLKEKNRKTERIQHALSVG
jgi:hypothetical protein